MLLLNFHSDVHYRPCIINNVLEISFIYANVIYMFTVINNLSNRTICVSEFGSNILASERIGKSEEYGGF